MQENEISPLYTLPAQLTAETASEVLEGLRGVAVSDQSHLTLDASGVENLTSSGAQILTALSKSATSSGKILSITGGTVFFSQALADLGLGGLIETSTHEGA